MCGGSDYPGCTDDAACNYDEGAGCDDGSCLYSDAIDGGGAARWTKMATLCDARTDPEGYLIDIETVAEHTEGELMGMTTYRLYAVLDNPSISFADRWWVVTARNQPRLRALGTITRFGGLESSIDTSMLAMDPNLAFDVSDHWLGESDGGPFPFSICLVATRVPSSSPEAEPTWAWATGRCS